MLADPQSITIATVAKSLPRTGGYQGNLESAVYREATGEVSLAISHTYQKRNRHLIAVDHKKTATDPLTAQTAEVGLGIRIILDVPKFGYSAADVRDVFAGVKTLLSDATVTKIVSGES